MSTSPCSSLLSNTPVHRTVTPLPAEGSSVRNSRPRFISLFAHLAKVVALVAAILVPTALSAQGTGRITGTVTGDGAQPLPDVQISLVGTSFGTVTDERGRYNLVNLPAGTFQLRAQRIGYRPISQSVTITAGGVETVDLALEAAPTALTKQVVVGYTTQQRKDVSDATSTVSAEDIEDQKVATVEEALRGRVPGVQINASGEPGRPAQVIIRGQNFFTNPTPLYVVDGMYLRQNPNLNPDDIESIEVLKDASAAAQYGAQAASGVIVIRTRRGRAAENNRIDFRTYYGFQEIPTRIDMMSAAEWGAVQKQAYDNAGLPVPQGVTDAIAGTTPNTDWQDAVFNRGKIMDHNLSVSGGNPNASYMLSGGLLDQTGSIIETGFRRYSFRVNSEARRGKFAIGENIALSRSRQQGLTGFPLIDVVRMLPTIPVRDPLNASGYGYGSGANPTFGTNPVGLLEKQPRAQTSNQVIGSAYAEYQLLPYLRYRLNTGVNYENFARSEFTSISQLRFSSANQFAILNEIRNNYTSLLAENLLMFDNAFGRGTHRLSAVAGYTSQRITTDDISALRRGFSDENLRVIRAGDETQSSNNGTTSLGGLKAFLVRANYTLMDRYIMTGSLRRDGSSKFGPSNRWAGFHALSLGWILSDEGFFKAAPFIGRADFLKLRASTGTLGNQDIGDYNFVAPISTENLAYPIGGQIEAGATQIRLDNPNIRWQQNRQDNFGIDMNLIGDRVTFTSDFYKSKSTGLLVQAPAPWSLGLGLQNNRYPTVNAGSMQNSGTEFGLVVRWGGNEPGDFHINTAGSLMTTRNKVLSLGNGGQPLYDENNVARTAVGGAIGEFYLVKTAGIFQSAAEVAAHTTTINGNPVVIQPGAQPGDVRYVDANGDGQISDQDRVNSGNGTPKFSGGLFFDGGYKMFDFALNFRGAGGFKIFNAAKYWTDRMDDPSNYRKGFEPWSPTNPSTTTPRALAAGNPNTRFNSDRWIEDGGYIKLQNIVIGVTLPPSITDRLGRGLASQSRIYLNMQNIATFTDFSNWDPETLGFGNPLGRGIDDGRIYPNVRTISLGLDLRL